MPSQPETQLYEYAVIRYVPRIERGEFLNIGLIMMCKRIKWLKIAITINEDRMRIFDNPFTKETLEHQLTTFKLVAAGNAKAGMIAELPVEERFRWLTAVKSSCIQTSRPHPGLTEDLDATFESLYHELVE